MRLFLVTHAHTEQISGVAADEWKLSARGIKQARQLSKAPFWQDVERIVVSSEQKCWLTVQNVVEQRQLPVWIDSRFDELRRGGWVEEYAGQVAKVFAEPTASVLGWERASDVCERVLAGIEDLRRFPDETLALVGHGLCLSILRAQILGQLRVDFAEWQRLSFASWASVEGDPLAFNSDFMLSAATVR